LGRSRSAYGALVLLLAGSAVAAFGPGATVWTLPALTAAVATCIGGVVAARTGRLSWLFRASMLVALVDVTMIIGRGHGL